MKNIIIASGNTVPVILSLASVFASDNDSKKASGHCSKHKENLLKFSINDFVGKDDIRAEKIDQPECLTQNTRKDFR